MSLKTYDALIVGGGAAGMMAAITAAQGGSRVMILEKNDRPCRKLYITGKGRCNLTNDCDWRECLENTPTNPKFLFSTMQAFPPKRTMDFFESLGCPLKVERGKRVFPVSDQAASVVDALREKSRALGVDLTSCVVKRLLTKDGAVCGAATDRGDFFAPCVLLATGGASYPRTGSTGDGYAIARQVGHTVTPLTGSLVPLEVESGLCTPLAGLTLRNVGVSLLDSAGKLVYEDFGEAEFTPFGLSGPTILSCSAHMGTKSGFTVVFDLKPALDAEKLDQKLQRLIAARHDDAMDVLLGALLPRQMISPVLHLAQVPFSQKAHSLPRESRLRLVGALKRFPVPIRAKRPVEEAIVTSGGVNVREVDPKTMQSKKLPGLYFAGELLDLDAYTGGFNLQIAWATGYAAGAAIAARKKERTSL